MPNSKKDKLALSPILDDGVTPLTVELNAGLKSTVKTSLKTLGLASLGTIALVGSHHLGRKQTNKNARLKDYVDGVLHAIGHQKKDALVKREASNTVSSNTALSNTASVTTINDPICWISGVANLKTQDFEVVGIDRSKHIVWKTQLPERVHDILIQPKLEKNFNSNNSQSINDNSNAKPFIHNQHVAVMGRRPSEWFWVLNANDGDIIYTLKAESNRHFYGHACYSLDGTLLYVTENNTDDFSGIIGVYDVALGYKKIKEFDTQGIGPHEIVMHPDGETLVIANGGIKTERASREELNLDSMKPSLVYLNRHNGELLEQVYPEHNQMSVRHLAMHEDGKVAIGIQFQGERHLSVPMLLTHQRGEATFTPLQLSKSDDKGWHRFHHYIASVAVHSKHNLLCATSPIGGCATIFDLTTGLMLGSVELPDCAGVANWNEVYSECTTIERDIPSFIVSDGQGFLTSIKVDYTTDAPILKIDKTYQPYAFDNHLNII